MRARLQRLVTVAGLWLICGLMAAPLAAEAPFGQAASTAKADLQAALERLRSLRQEIAAEQIPLANRLHTLDAEVLEQRRELERAQRLRERGELDLAQMEAELSMRREELRYVVNLLAEYTRQQEARLDVAELGRWDTLLGPAKKALDTPDTPLAQRIEALQPVVDAGLERARGLSGGRLVEGHAILPDGLRESGTFYLSGPLSWFLGETPGVAGVAQAGAALDARLYPLEGRDAENIKQLVQNGYGVVPADPTLGDVLALRATRENLAGHIAKGGIWIFPILGFGLLATIIAIAKAVEIFGLREPDPKMLGRLHQLLRDGDTRQAMELAESIRGPFGPMLADAVRHHREERDLLDEILYEHVLKLQPKLEKWLPLIAVTAATAPLLGLLGTVTGMIKTFNLITVFGTGDARALSGGISEALVTTEFGLIVAIPALVVHALLQRRAQGILSHLENTAVAFINSLPARGSDTPDTTTAQTGASDD